MLRNFFQRCDGQHIKWERVNSYSNSISQFYHQLLRDRTFEIGSVPPSLALFSVCIRTTVQIFKLINFKARKKTCQNSWISCEIANYIKTAFYYDYMHLHEFIVIKAMKIPQVWQFPLQRHLSKIYSIFFSRSNIEALFFIFKMKQSSSEANKLRPIFFFLEMKTSVRFVTRVL